jgi:TonB family protein
MSAMREGDGEGQLRWAFALALALHVAALAGVSWLPAALGASAGDFEEIRVFDAAAPALISPVDLVEWPAEDLLKPPVAPSVPDLVALDKPEPRRRVDPEPPLRPTTSATPEPRPARPKTPAAEPPAPQEAEGGKPARAEPAAPASATDTPGPGRPGGGGGGGGFVDLGSPSPHGELPAPAAGGTPIGELPGEGTGSGTGVGPGSGGGTGGGSGGGVGTGDGTGVGPGTGSGSGGSSSAGGFSSRVADRRAPRVVRKGSLEYPPSAVAEGVQGTVRLKVLVTEEGEAAEVEVVDSSGDHRLDAAAAEFVKGWRYLPAVQDGEPRRVHTYARVEFELK